MTSEGLHEPPDRLRPGTVDRHRAIASIMEELEAVDWYDQRVDATEDPELAAVLAHNRDEEKEHAAMVLEWLRRHDPVLDRHLRTYLFTTGSIVGLEREAEHGGADGDGSDGGSPDGDETGGDEAGGGSAPAATGDGDLGIGDMKETSS